MMHQTLSLASNVSKNRNLRRQWAQESALIDSLNWKYIIWHIFTLLTVQLLQRKTHHNLAPNPFLHSDICYEDELKHSSCIYIFDALSCFHMIGWTDKRTNEAGVQVFLLMWLLLNSGFFAVYFLSGLGFGSSRLLSILLWRGMWLSSWILYECY